MSEKTTNSSKRASFDTSTCVLVLVGQDEHSFMVHQHILEKHSPFFQAALNRGFKEEDQRIIRLPEIDPRIFNRYIEWSYTGQLVLSDAAHEEKPSMGLIQTPATGLYIVADRMSNIKLQNAIIDYLRTFVGQPKTPGTTMVTLAYEQLPENSKLRKFLLDWYLGYASLQWLKKDIHQLPHSFVQELALGWGQGMEDTKKRTALLSTTKCYYHEHNHEVPECT